MTRVRSLTAAQQRKLAELEEPNKNPHNTWYFPQRDLRTLNVLARKGFARAEDDAGGLYGSRYGFSITPRGREELRRLGVGA